MNQTCSNLQSATCNLQSDSVLGWAAVTAILIAALIIPGYALLLYVPALAGRFSGFCDRAIAALCLSVLLTPLVFLAMRLLGVPLGGPILLLLLVASLAAIGLKLRGQLSLRRANVRENAVSRPPTSNPSQLNLVAALPAPRWRISVDWVGLALFAIFVIAFVVRVHQAWGEPAALGSDGYHHTLISQLIIEQQGVPRNYLPYAPLTSFTYHYGFHAQVAISYWLGGWVIYGVGSLTTAKLTLIVGQLLSALAPFAIYLLAATWLKNRAAALVAALIPLLSIFPTYYLNWGRDTQMAGLLGLPVLMLVTTMLLDAPPNPNPLPQGERESDSPPPQSGEGLGERARGAASSVATTHPRHRATIVTYLSGNHVPALILLTATLAVGLLLDHYRIVILYAYFVGIYWLVSAAASLFSRTWAGHRPPLQPSYLIPHTSRPLAMTIRLAAVGLLALIIASPWLLNLLGGFSFTLQTGSNLPAQSFFSTRLSDIVDNWWWNRPLWQASGASGLLTLLPTFTSPLMILSMAGWLFGILYRNRYVISIGLLTVVALVLSSPYFINVPLLSGRVDYQTVASLLWLPQGLLIGYLAVATMRLRPATFWQRRSVVAAAIGTSLFVAILAAFSIWDAREADPLEAYLQPADVAALQWAHQNTNENSLFLANTFTWGWSPNSRAGSDGGLWLPLIAGGGRSSTAPPLPYNNEKSSQPDYRNAVITTSRAANHVDDAASVDYLRSIGVKYAYIGARSTSPAIAPPNQSSNPELATVRDKNLIISGNLDPAQFQRAPQFWRQIYARDGVYIFALK